MTVSRFFALLSPGRWSLSVKLPLTITAVVAGVAFTIGLAIVIQERQRLIRGVEERTIVLGRAIASSSAEAVISHDYWYIYKMLKAATTKVGMAERDPRVLWGMVLDKDGRVLAHLDPARYGLGFPLPLEERPAAAQLVLKHPTMVRGRSNGSHWIEGVVPILSGADVLGTVRLRLSTDEVADEMLATSLNVLGHTLMLAMIGSLLGTVISNRMVRPLKALGNAMESLKTDHVIVPLPVRDRDEIGHLVERFNSMAAELIEKRRIEQELAMAEKITAVGRIAAGVAHEVNNPLGGMLNCVDTLKRHADDPGILTRYLPLLERGLKRIQGIVQALLVEVRAESAETWGSCQCLDDVRELVNAETGDRPIVLEWDNQVEEAFVVNCEKVQQVVLNLLRNAIQAMPDGGTLRFTARADSAAVTFEIADTGTGIPEEHATRIFDPFFTTRAAGTGLGLWIVYRLIEAMQGTIGVISEPGRGTTFRVIIPVRNTDEVANA